MTYQTDPRTGEPVNISSRRTDYGYVVVRRWEPDTAAQSQSDEYFHAVSLTDTSSPWPTSTHYDPDCGWCWLGAPHTADAHSAKTSHRTYV